MDLGIAGKTALVCAASKGLGRGCALALARNGVAVTITARTEDAGGAAAEIARASGSKVTAGGRRHHHARRPRRRARRLSGARHPGQQRRRTAARRLSASGTRRTGRSACNANMITAIMLIKATVDGMIARKFGRIVNITSSSVKAPIPQLGLSNGARAGLTGFVAGIARQTVEHNVTINNILPGRFDTDRLRAGLAFAAQKSGRPVAEVEAEARPDPGQAVRHARGVRRAVRLHLQRPGELHHRPELPDRRRPLPRDVLSGAGRGRRCAHPLSGGVRGGVVYRGVGGGPSAHRCKWCPRRNSRRRSSTPGPVFPARSDDPVPGVRR